MYPNLRTNCIRVIEEAMTKKRAKGATVSYSGGVEKLSGGSRVRECRELGEEEPQEPALPTPATFVGLAVSAPPPDRYSDSTGFFPRIRRIFPSGKIPENEGNIRYLSGKIR